MSDIKFCVDCKHYEPLASCTRASTPEHTSPVFGPSGRQEGIKSCFAERESFLCNLLPWLCGTKGKYFKQK